MQTPTWVAAESQDRPITNRQRYLSEPPPRERYYPLADRPHTPVADDINGGNSGSFPVQKRSCN